YRQVVDDVSELAERMPELASWLAEAGPLTVDEMASRIEHVRQSVRNLDKAVLDRWDTLLDATTDRRVALQIVARIGRTVRLQRNAPQSQPELILKPVDALADILALPSVAVPVSPDAAWPE